MPRTRSISSIWASRHCFSNALKMPERGVTLVEVIIGVSVFVLVGVAIYGAFVFLLRVSERSRARLLALEILNEHMEVIRNVPYAQVGIAGGIPTGIFPRTSTTTRSGILFTITRTVRNVDDPFDGTVDSIPRDTAPADYKRVDLEVSCAVCPTGASAKIFAATLVAPKGLETSSDNGALFIQVLDESGNPVGQANVRVWNNTLIPRINLEDVTDNNGTLQLVDVPPAANSYQVMVTKAGYSTDATSVASSTNPNPLKPPATVAAQTVTRITFIIDRLSTLSLQTLATNCRNVGNVSFRLQGTKLIGTSPDVLKFSRIFATDATGQLSPPELETDTYTLALVTAGYDLAGSNPPFPFRIDPNLSASATLSLTPRTTNSLLVTVRDAGTQLPLADAVVRVTSTVLLYDRTLVTGKGYLRQTDWSGGSGQYNLVTSTRYYADNGLVDAMTSPGDLTLFNIGGSYVNQGFLESSSFDTGLDTTYGSLLLDPLVQSASAGPASVRVQVATSNDNATWVYRGPDSTTSTYYTATNVVIAASHANHRYFRYRVYLSTKDTRATPRLSEIAFIFSSGCIPGGQVFFSELAAATYTLTVTRSGYQLFTASMPVSGATRFTVLLSP